MVADVMFTEWQAKEHRCCGPEGCGTMNRDLDISNPDALLHYCIGSACMAWRWWPLMADGDFKIALQQAHAKLELDRDKKLTRQQAIDYVMAHRSEFGLPEKPERGYCGLAGEPKL